MHIAVKRGSAEAIEALLNMNEIECIQEYLNVDNYGGQERWTALHLASYSSYYRIVSLLLGKRADIFIRNGKGKTPLSNISNNLLMIKLLKKAEI